MSASTTALSTIPRGESLGQRAFRLLKRNRSAVFCISIVSLYILVTALGWLNLLPDFQERVGGEIGRAV